MTKTLKKIISVITPWTIMIIYRSYYSKDREKKPDLDIGKHTRE